MAGVQGASLHSSRLLGVLKSSLVPDGGFGGPAIELKLSEVVKIELVSPCLLYLSGVLRSITVDDIGSSGNQSCSSSFNLDCPVSEL